MLRAVTQDALPLRTGDSGDEVRDLQRRLGHAGYRAEGDVHGRFGRATESAVRSFQAARGLRSDAVCGSQTWEALIEAGWRLGDRLVYERIPMLRGDDVADLQARLGRLGFFADRVDGIFGPRTAGALADFQRNAGLTADGVCGPDSVVALSRVGSRSDQQVKAGLVEREQLRVSPRRLLDRRVMVGAGGGLGALADAVIRSLRSQGAVAAACHHPDQSAQAAEANRFEADLYLGLAVQAVDGCTCAFYGQPDYASVGGRRLAEQLASELATALGLAQEGMATPMRIPVLRETRMTAVQCELGGPPRVVAATPALALALTAGLVAWVAAPIEG